MEINGVKLDFSMFNEDKADVRSRYYAELEKMRHIKENIPEGTPKEQNAFLCNAIKGLFDNVFGSGTGVRVCGEGNDLLLHMDAYDQLVSEQIRQQNKYKGIMNRMKNMKVKK